MEAALVSAATGALKPVLSKLTALLGDKYKRFKGVRKEIKLLTDELAAMHNFLLKMSEVEDPDVQDKAWMNEVRELSYDMEDAIDDFMLCIDDKDIKPDGFMEKIKSSLGRMKASNRIGSEIQDLKNQIIEVGERNARYKTGVAISNTKNATVDPRVINVTIDTRSLAIFEPASKLVGIDEPRSEIIKLLTEDDGCEKKQQQLKVVSIYGCGGMGKTTLANQVYQKLKFQFEFRAFVSVSQNPNMMNLLRTILSEVGNRSYADTEAGSIQQLISKINDLLVDKRYFIVVDDIWKKETWDVIKCILPVNNCGSKIITTTRMNDVADSCQSSFSGHIYNIRPLSMVDSRQLFHRLFFDSKEDCPSCLEEVSDQILKKCDGLPLAIIAISGLLANTERTEHLWNQVKESIGCALERNPDVEGMIKILSLSYFDLPPHLKTCLLYLSMFPEDSIIDRKGLIRRWIAEGFIHKEGRYTVQQLGERYFNELVNRSLIQPVKKHGYGKVIGCRVHDIILDFIIAKSVEENFVTLLGMNNLTIRTQSKVRRLSLQVGKQENFTIPTGLVMSHVRSLCLRVGMNTLGFFAKIPALDEFRRLRVLDFRGCNHMENHHLASIGRLFQLRYLNIRKTGITELPNQIGHLRFLEILDIRDTQVCELPTAIANLEKLTHLLVGSRVEFPDGIAKMQALEMLKRVGVFSQSLNFLQELGQLKNLRKLDLYFQADSATGDTKGVEERKKAIVSSLYKIGSNNLCSLTILNGGRLLQGSLFPTLLSLQKLMTWCSTVPQIPNWVGSLLNIQQLRFEVERVRQEDLHILGGLPALLILEITRTKLSEDRLKVNGGVGFRCLRDFCYYRTQIENMDLMFAVGSMPKLEKLEIVFSAESQRLVNSGAFDFGIENLPNLVTLICGLRGGYVTNHPSATRYAKSAMERVNTTHPNHPSVFFI